MLGLGLGLGLQKNTSRCCLEDIGVSEHIVGVLEYRCVTILNQIWRVKLRNSVLLLCYFLFFGGGGFLGSSLGIDYRLARWFLPFLFTSVDSSLNSRLEKPRT